MKLLLSLLLLLSCSTAQKLNNKNFNWDREFIPIMQGTASETSTVINFIVPKNFSYEVQALRLSDNKKISFKEKITTIKSSPWQIVNLYFKDLKLKEEYELRVKTGRHGYFYTDKRYFKTFDAKKDNLTISVSSCMSDDYVDIADKAWSSIDKKSVDALFLIGDAVYADYHNGRYIGVPVSHAEEVWGRHIDARNTLPLYRLKKLRPVFAMWDDHDMGKNNGNKDYRFLKEVKKYFRDFFPVEESNILKKGKGLGFSLELAFHKFYFLDNRSFREKKKDGEHLGKAQTKWLYQTLKESSKMNWLIEGDQFFGGYQPFESFEGNHNKKFKELLQHLKELGKKYVFISGDRHLYELMKVSKDEVGMDTFEVTTSGIHTKIYPGAEDNRKNDRRVKVIDNEYNSLFLFLKKDKGSYEVINEQGKILDQRILIH